MATFIVALFIIFIGIGLSASRADEQQNETENGGGLKHLLGTHGIRENQNAMVEKVSGIEAKLEKQIEKGMRDTLILLSTKLENVFSELRDNQNLLFTKLEKVFTELRDKQNEGTTKLENEIRDTQKALSLMKNNSTLAHFHFPIPIYRWNATDCHPEIVINESTNAIQPNGTEGFRGFCSCRAGPIRMPSSDGRIGIIYTEYRIIADKGGLSIGLSTKKMPLGTSIGLPSFNRIGDVRGCGVNWATRQVFFTKNGQRLNYTNLYVKKDTADLYPTVTLSSFGDAVEANFGPNFEYDLSNEF